MPRMACGAHPRFKQLSGEGQKIAELLKRQDQRKEHIDLGATPPLGAATARIMPPPCYPRLNKLFLPILNSAFAARAGHRTRKTRLWTDGSSLMTLRVRLPSQCARQIYRPESREALPELARSRRLPSMCYALCQENGDRPIHKFGHPP